MRNGGEKAGLELIGLPGSRLGGCQLLHHAVEGTSKMIELIAAGGGDLHARGAIAGGHALGAGHERGEAVEQVAGEAQAQRGSARAGDAQQGQEGGGGQQGHARGLPLGRPRGRLLASQKAIERGVGVIARRSNRVGEQAQRNVGRRSLGQHGVGPAVELGLRIACLLQGLPCRLVGSELSGLLDQSAEARVGRAVITVAAIRGQRHDHCRSLVGQLATQGLGQLVGTRFVGHCPAQWRDSVPEPSHCHDGGDDRQRQHEGVEEDDLASQAHHRPSTARRPSSPPRGRAGMSPAAAAERGA